MKKFLLKAFMLLCLILWGGVSSAWAETIEIVYSDFSNTSYSASESTFTKSGQTFGYVNVMKNGNNGTPAGWAKEQVIQCKASGTFYNTTPISDLKSVRVYLVVNTNSFTVTAGSTSELNDYSQTRPTTATGTESITYTKYENKTTTAGQSATASYYDFDLSGVDGVQYFKIANGSSTIYIHKIVITYGTDGDDSGDGETYNFSSFDQAENVSFDAENFTIVLHKNAGSTAPQWNASSSEARVYANGSVDVSSTKNISKIVYNYTINANSKGVSPTVDGAAGKTNAGTWDADTKTWTGTDKLVTLTTSGTAGNLGFKSITVYFEEEAEPTYTVNSLTLVATDGTNYYATFSKTNDVFIPEADGDIEYENTVYTVYVYGDMMELQEVDKSEGVDVNGTEYDGYYVPANSGVLIKTGFDKEEKTIPYFDVENVSVSALTSDNFLRAETVAKETDGSYKFYMLAYGDEALTPSTLGFYWGADQGAAFVSRPNSAYLALPKETEARGFSFSDDTEALESIEMNATTTIYTLNGVKVNELQKGLNIVNGKKVMVRE